MERFGLILSNTVLLSGIYSWFIAQFLKIIIDLIRKKDINLRTRDFFLKVVFGTGGMPSSHSATISAVAISIGMTKGFDSPIFAFAVIMVGIIIRDATGVRLSTGKQAEAINIIMENQYRKDGVPYHKLKEVRGHKPLETFVGALVGVLVSLGMFFID